MARTIKSGGRFGMNQPKKVIKTPARFTTLGVVRALGRQNGTRVVTAEDALQLLVARRAAGVTTMDKNFVRQVKPGLGGAALKQVERQNTPVTDSYTGV
jgi:hypothetical protein